MEGLRSKKQAAADKLDELKSSSGKAWDDIKAGLDSAMAGYDPSDAIAFWQRMAAQRKGGTPPEFLSTHPAHETRIDQIKDYLPETMKYYLRK
jgi:hypothetical protein